MQIFKPPVLKHPGVAIITASFGSGSIPETIIGRALAGATGTVGVNLFNVPNQPLFGKTEDELVAYTLGKYLETGDETWPLLLPMTKSVIKGMDAITEWSENQGGEKITKFVVSGASKRGWTTYLAAAGDPRVVAMIPFVYNNLDLPKQLLHQREVWKETSPLVAPYTKIGLFEQMGTERGKQLVSIIDPMSIVPA